MLLYLLSGHSPFRSNGVEMLTYRLQARRIVIDKLPAFPAEAVVKMKLEPKVPFGGLAGPSRTLPKGGTGKFKVDTARGTFVCNLDEALYPALNFATAFQENDERESQFRLDGNVLSMKFDCADVNALVSSIILFENIFPAILTAYMPDAPCAVEITGTLAGRKFSWLYDAESLRLRTVVATADGQKENICSSYGMMLA